MNGWASRDFRMTPSGPEKKLQKLIYLFYLLNKLGENPYLYRPWLAFKRFWLASYVQKKI